MDREARKRCCALLKRRGFDRTTSSRDGTVRPRCSQCQVLVICGVTCHENGCPNSKR
jgi:hypothetical protein